MSHPDALEIFISRRFRGLWRSGPLGPRSGGRLDRTWAHSVIRLRPTSESGPVGASRRPQQPFSPLCESQEDGPTFRRRFTIMDPMTQLYRLAAVALHT